MTDSKKTPASEPTLSKKEGNGVEARGTSRDRPVRITRDLLVKKGPLVVPESAKREGFINFWMRDEPYKFEKYVRLGYDFALDSEGKKISVGRTGETMYLLEIPKELHDEIKAVKHELRLEHTAEIRDIKKPRGSGSPERIFEEHLSVK